MTTAELLPPPLALAAARVLEGPTIPVCRPYLPEASAVLPYLSEIDANHWYTNFGPLLRRLEERLATHFGCADGVACVASGTTALTLALLAQRAPHATLCVMPSWTFAATGHAVRAAGLVPYFVDVDERTWALTPARAESAISAAPGVVGAVVVVAPFGAPTVEDEWERFAARTGLPVVIDGAASFDTARASSIPATVSMHATKVFGVGEGGMVVCTDTDMIESVRQLCNYGFTDSNWSMAAGLNAKLSEYAAAVGLAALDEWDVRRRTHVALTTRYREGLAEVPTVALAPGYGDSWVTSTCVVRLVGPGTDLRTAVSDMAAHGIETRRWWGDGCHSQPAFACCPAQPLPVSERLSATTLGIPYHLGLQPTDQDRIIESLAGLGRDANYMSD